MLPGALRLDSASGPCSPAESREGGQTAGRSAPEPMFSTTLFCWRVGGSVLRPVRFYRQKACRSLENPLVCTHTPPPGPPSCDPPAAARPVPGSCLQAPASRLTLPVFSEAPPALTHSESTTFDSITAQEVRVT